MTATLLVIVPVALLALIGTFYFVGCTLDTHGLGLGFTQYSDIDIIPNLDCVAYWQLADSPGQNLALDTVGKLHGDPHHGTYKNAGNVSGADSGLFPIPGFQVNPTTHSAAVPGTTTIGAAGIVTGDTLPPHDKDNPTSATCMQTNGGFVTVAANAACNPPVFSIECWVRPEWDAGDAPATRQFIDSRNVTAAGVFGYGLRVNEDGKWEATIGASGAAAFTQIIGDAAALNEATHVVLTFDGEFGSLFTNGERAAQAVQIPVGSTFNPNLDKPIIIGAGGPYLDNRTKGAAEPPPLFPFLPFKGKIQDVAIYKAVLSDTLIKNHAEHGKGNATG